MQKILQLLTENPIVSDYEIIDYRQKFDMQYIKLKIHLTDDTILHVREYISNEERDYSYHWQKKDGTLLIRWDNAPHHPHIETYPHHKHTPNLSPSKAIDVPQILTEIKDRIESSD